MKNVLLLVHDDVGQEARLQTALDLTRAIDGHMTCVDVTILPFLGGDYTTGAGQAMLLADERQRESKNKSVVEGRLAHEDVSWNWLEFTGSLAEGVLEAAALADLIVLNRKLDSFYHPDMRDAASSVLMHARAPVVAVPDTLERFEFSRALIAWDGKTSSAATMRACVPLLALAEAVEIFMVRDGSEKVEATEAAEYLSRHGIQSTVCIIEDGLTAADQLIAAECERWQGDYVLMGAYNHGRLAETFGGVTKRMLTTSKVPMVLGH